jgi:hypothetical protein
MAATHWASATSSLNFPFFDADGRSQQDASDDPGCSEPTLVGRFRSVHAERHHKKGNQDMLFYHQGNHSGNGSEGTQPGSNQHRDNRDPHKPKTMTQTLHAVVIT